MTMRDRRPSQFGALAGVQRAGRAVGAARARVVLSLRMKLIGVVLVTTLAALMAALTAMVVVDLRAYHQAGQVRLEITEDGETTEIAVSTRIVSGNTSTTSIAIWTS